MLLKIERKRIAASEWQKNNPERAAQRKREWYLKNRQLCIQRSVDRKRQIRGPVEILTPEQRIDNHKQYMRDYYAANKETIIQRWIDAKKKYMTNPMYRTKESLRSRVAKAFIQKGFTKKSRTFEIVGCSFDDLAQHIEKQFAEGMSWGNRNEWHIDHIVPLSVAETEAELIKLGHYSNLRPLFAKDNLAKSDQMLNEFIPLRITLLGR
jgi:hypothetical protein